MRKTISSFSVALLLSVKALSQSADANPLRWGIETELVQPFLPTIQIARLTATRTVLGPEHKMPSEALIGMYIRPNVKHDVVEKINEYMVVVGYRQFLWKGLHLEARSNMGYAWGTNNLIDGQDYETPTWFWEGNVGYRINVTNRATSSIYLIPQFGAIGNIVGDIGPRGGKPDNFIQGNLVVGVKF